MCIINFPMQLLYYADSFSLRIVQYNVHCTVHCTVLYIVLYSVHCTLYCTVYNQPSCPYRNNNLLGVPFAIGNL